MQEKYLTVTALTRYIKKKIDIDPHLQSVWLTGEISNYNHHGSGHIYLTIKDNNSRIDSVMFSWDNKRLKFTPEHGMHVLIKGNISVYEPNGKYQLYIKQMEPDGIGSLYLAYEQLKNKLEKAGLFDEIHKRKIPKYPTEIGVITSPTGAAVKDIITTIKRRYPIVKITIIPVIVQGDQGAQSIVNGIERANASQHFDTLIVGRGGGSLEDLWNFNEEMVVRAIFNSQIPIISAVGHETDVTLSDFVADLRAVTPTGAAELAVPSLHELKRNLIDTQLQIRKLMEIYLQKQSIKLAQLKSAYAFHIPQQLLLKNAEYIDRLNENLKQRIILIEQSKTDKYNQLVNRLAIQHPKKSLLLAENAVNNVTRQLTNQTSQHLQQKAMQLHSLIEKLTLVNPLHTIQRGFAIPYTEDDKILKTIKEVAIDDKIKLRLIDGYIESKVIQIEEDANYVKE